MICLNHRQPKSRQSRQARAAYGMGRILQRRCGSYLSVVPDAAMSAATLLTVGGSEIVMGPESSLGPLDVQIKGPEDDYFTSALNEVQALERIRAYALESVDETMMLLGQRMRKRPENLLPAVLRFVADTMEPLLGKIDVIHYNERARILKVGEEYAVRLLMNSGAPMERESARVIAAHLVERYPEHGFWIDREEALTIGLPVRRADDETDEILESLWQTVQGVVAFGQFDGGTP